jgi:hypothetical protein
MSQQPPGFFTPPLLLELDQEDAAYGLPFDLDPQENVPNDDDHVEQQRQDQPEGSLSAILLQPPEQSTVFTWPPALLETLSKINMDSAISSEEATSFVNYNIPTNKEPHYIFKTMIDRPHIFFNVEDTVSDYVDRMVIFFEHWTDKLDDNIKLHLKQLLQSESYNAKAMAMAWITTKSVPNEEFVVLGPFSDHAAFLPDPWFGSHGCVFGYTILRNNNGYHQLMDYAFKKSCPRLTTKDIAPDATRNENVFFPSRSRLDVKQVLDGLTGLQTIVQSVNQNIQNYKVVLNALIVVDTNASSTEAGVHTDNRHSIVQKCMITGTCFSRFFVHALFTVETSKTEERMTQYKLLDTDDNADATVPVQIDFLACPEKDFSFYKQESAQLLYQISQLREHLRNVVETHWLTQYITNKFADSQAMCNELIQSLSEDLSVLEFDFVTLSAFASNSALNLMRAVSCALCAFHYKANTKIATEETQTTLVDEMTPVVVARRMIRIVASVLDAETFVTTHANDEFNDRHYVQNYFTSTKQVALFVTETLKETGLPATSRNTIKNFLVSMISVFGLFIFSCSNDEQRNHVRNLLYKAKNTGNFETGIRALGDDLVSRVKLEVKSHAAQQTNAALKDIFAMREYANRKEFEKSQTNKSNEQKREDETRYKTYTQYENAHCAFLLLTKFFEYASEIDVDRIKDRTHYTGVESLLMAKKLARTERQPIPPAI